MSLRWLISALVSSALLVLLHTWALADALYWRFRWFDTPMHVLGGFTMASFAVGLLGRAYRPQLFLAFVAVATIGWEIFEFYSGAPQPQPVLFDTAHDLVNDAIGAMLAFALAKETVWLPQK